MKSSRKNFSKGYQIVKNDFQHSVAGLKRTAKSFLERGRLARQWFCGCLVCLFSPFLPSK